MISDPIALLIIGAGVAGSLVAPRLSRHLPPGVAAVLLTALALTVSVSLGVVLCAAGALAMTETVPGLGPGDWALPVLRTATTLPPIAGLIAGLVGATLLGRAVVFAVRSLRGMRRTFALAASLPAVEGVAIVADQEMHAYAVPGRRARIVLSTGLLRSLSARQRAAVLAHERAHLAHHHYVYSQLARLAAAANPLMRPLAAAVETALERWADADAARSVGDRTTVAHALGVAALGSRSASAPALCAARNAVVERVRYLLEPPPTRPRIAALLIVAAGACWFGAAATLWRMNSAVQLAESVYRR